MKTLDIVYLHHSGFAVMTDKHLLIFDYYQDPADKLPALPGLGKTCYVFSSHAHGDHFIPAISEWQDKVAGYILSNDIKSAGGLAVKPEQIHYAGLYQQLELEGVKVTTYGSTDQGLSFAVEADGWRIFHAGDLNWWHWKGDTPENLRLAEEGFRSELARLSGDVFDVAFFPVDSRLEECRTMGVNEFIQTVQVRQLVTMHHCGDVWTAPPDFPGSGKEIAVWSPPAAGAGLQVKK